MSTVQEISQARLNKWRRMEREGISRSEIARQEGISRQRVSSLLGPIPHRKEGRKERSVYMTDKAWTQVSALAAKHGLRLKAGQTAGEGSVSLLLDQIAKGNLIIVRKQDVAPKGAPIAAQAESAAA